MYIRYFLKLHPPQRGINITTATYCLTLLLTDQRNNGKNMFYSYFSVYTCFKQCVHFVYSLSIWFLYLFLWFCHYCISISYRRSKPFCPEWSYGSTKKVFIVTEGLVYDRIRQRVSSRTKQTRRRRRMLRLLVLQNKTLLFWTEFHRNATVQTDSEQWTF